MPVIEGTAGLKTVAVEWDFAVDGGAVGSTPMRPAPGEMHGSVIPAGSVIVGGYLDVLAAVTTSASGTLALTAESAGDLLAATAAASLSTGRKDIVPDNTGSTAVKTTAARTLTATIATGALTAGKVRLVVEYR